MRCSAAEPIRDRGESERDTYVEHNTRTGGVFPRTRRLRTRWPRYPRRTLASTRWHARAFARSAAVAALTLGLAWLVTVATDEGSISWGARAGRAFPLAPACAAIGTWAALAPIRPGLQGATPAGAPLARGNMTSAVAGGALVAWMAATIIAMAPAVTVTVFFPRSARASAWVWEDGAFIDHAQGLRVSADGTPTFLANKGSAPLPAIPRHGRAAVSIATACVGLALPLLVSHALLVRSVGRTMGGADSRRSSHAVLIAVLATGAALVASAVGFQAAAARNVSALLGMGPLALLLAFALARYRASS